MKENKMLYLDQEDIKILKRIVQLHKNNEIALIDVIRKGGLFDWASIVCSYYGISLEEFLSPNRSQHLVFARRDFVHLVSKNTNHTCGSIGNFMKRDHTSVLYHKKCRPIHMYKIEEEVSNVENFSNVANVK